MMLISNGHLSRSNAIFRVVTERDFRKKNPHHINIYKLMLYCALDGPTFWIFVSSIKSSISTHRVFWIEFKDKFDQSKSWANLEMVFRKKSSKLSNIDHKGSRNWSCLICGLAFDELSCSRYELFMGNFNNLFPSEFGERRRYLIDWPLRP